MSGLQEISVPNFLMTSFKRTLPDSYGLVQRYVLYLFRICRFIFFMEKSLLVKCNNVSMQLIWNSFVDYKYLVLGGRFQHFESGAGVSLNASAGKGIDKKP